MNASILKDAVKGAVTLAFLGAIIWLCLALYSQKFVSSVQVTVEAPRAGLLMDAGADVKMRGVVVGRVGSVDATTGGATLELDMDPDLMGRIPQDVRVSIVPPTVFGSKYVEMVGDSSGQAPALQAGQTINGASVTVEINQTFDSARQALDRLEPDKLNAMLSSTADLVRGRGEQLGELIVGGEQLISRIEDDVPAIGETSRLAAELAEFYEPSVDDLVETVDRGSKVVDNLGEQDSELRSALVATTDAATTVDGFLTTNETGLRDLTSVLRPTMQLLNKYAPGYRCTLEGVAYNDQLLSAIMGGPQFGGSHRNAHVTFMAQRGLPAYTYPEDLPKVATKSGPNCAGLPRVEGKVPYYNYDTGSNPYVKDQDSLELGDTPIGLALFGETFQKALEGK